MLEGESKFTESDPLFKPESPPDTLDGELGLASAAGAAASDGLSSSEIILFNSFLTTDSIKSFNI
jgi:hypothetical protein